MMLDMVMEKKGLTDSLKQNTTSSPSVFSLEFKEGVLTEASDAVIFLV